MRGRFISLRAYRALGGASKAFKFVVRENRSSRARGVKRWFEGRVAIDTPNAGWRLVLGPTCARREFLSKALGIPRLQQLAKL